MNLVRLQKGRSMDAYIVIGRQHSYKSSVIRSLSGSRVSGVRPYVLLPNKMTSVYVHLSSLQEGNGILPQDFVKLVNATKADAVLFALRPNKRSSFPNANKYLQYFIGKGWTIRKVAVLNTTTSPFLTTNLNNTCLQFFPLGPQPVAVNRLAANVRSHFGCSLTLPSTRGELVRPYPLAFHNALLPLILTLSQAFLPHLYKLPHLF